MVRRQIIIISIFFISAVFKLNFKIFSFSLNDAAGTENKRELGKINWYKDFEKAKARAKKNNELLFVLFTEVPGCSTVKNYGKKY